MTGEVVKFGNAEFHYRWTHEAAGLEYDALKALNEELLAVFVKAKQSGLMGSQEAYGGYHNAVDPVARRMADLKAAYWYADRIVLKADD